MLALKFFSKKKAFYVQRLKEDPHFDEKSTFLRMIKAKKEEIERVQEELAESGEDPYLNSKHDLSNDDIFTSLMKHIKKRDE
jgi:hypothetical protein